MIGTYKLNIQWSDDNHAHIQNPDDGAEFNITVRPRKMWHGGKAVKPRLYVTPKGGSELPFRSQIKRVKEHFGPSLNKILNCKVDLKFSSKAGCSCGCSPGFIIQNDSIPFDIWMDEV